MKRRTHPNPRGGRAPYSLYSKAPYSYPSWCRATAKGGHTPEAILKECRQALSIVSSPKSKSEVNHGWF